MESAMSRYRSWTYVLVLASAATATLLVVPHARSGDSSVLAGAQEQQGATTNNQEETSDEHRQGRPSATSSTRSSPIGITPHNKFVWSVNPDNNSVSVFSVARDANKKIAE